MEHRKEEGSLIIHSDDFLAMAGCPECRPSLRSALTSVLADDERMTPNELDDYIGREI